MPAAKIHLFPHPILRQQTKTVEKFDGSLGVILKRMAHVMTLQPSGIGIAAPQIGICQRIAIVDVSARVKGAKRLFLINPEIVQAEGESLSREGCMSLPDYTAMLKRYERIQVVWQDESGARREKEAHGIEAVCIQHEIDHLAGKLFIDRVASLRTDMIPRPKFTRHSAK